MTTAALRRWFIGSDLDWRAYGIDTPVYVGEDSTVTARFTVNSSGKTVTVDGTSSTASASTITGYRWDFGDGATATGVRATHTYATAGTFTVALTVTDDRNTTAADEQDVTITVPDAAFTWTAAGSTATFDGSTSTDVGTTITGYRWDFGDGTTGTGVTVSHTYATSGTRTVTLTVTDAAGATDTQTQQVTIALPPSNPVAAFTVAVANGIATFDLSASSTTNATITRFDLTFGDGATWFGTSRTVTHPYAVGTWTATLKITDSQGRTATVSHPVTVNAPVNQPPTAAFTATPSGVKVSFSAVTSSDGDGTITGYAWTFGDGGTGTGVNPTHDYTASGTYTVRLTVTDNLGATGTATKTVTVVKPSTDIDYFASTTATKSTTLVPASVNAVTQHFNRSEATGEFYSSQTHGESDGVTESVRLSRLRTDGTLIDQMFLTYAGHGSMFELEYVAGVMYIWLTWQRNSLGGTPVNDWVRFPYKAGTFTRSQVAGLTVKIPGPTYRLYAFDVEAGYACVRTTTSSSETFTRYPLANVKAGNLTGAVGKWTYPMSPPTPQGFATYYDGFFRYVGAPTDDPDWATDKPTLTEHSWTSGNTVRTLDMTSYLGTGRGEPESVAVYNTGTNPVLFFGFSYGPVGGPHTYPSWWFPLKDQTTPPKPSGPPGDPGVNRFGNSTQQTGSGIVGISAVTGAAFSAAGAGNFASLPPGTFTLTNFTEAWGSGNYKAGAAIRTGIKGILGAGSNSTVIQLPPGSTPPAIMPPTTEMLIQGNNGNFTSVGAVPSGYIIDGIHLKGVATSTIFNGVYLHSVTNFTLSNTTISLVKGNAGSPPGETFMWNLQRIAPGTSTVSHVTFDGSNEAAAGLGTNYMSAQAVLNVSDSVFKNMAYSAGIAMHGTFNGGQATFKNIVMTNNHRNFGIEANGGNVDFYDPLWDDKRSGFLHDFNITWTSGNYEGRIRVFFTTQAKYDAFKAMRNNPKFTIIGNFQSYGDATGSAPYSGTKRLVDYFEVWIGGVKKVTTDYSTGWNGAH